MKPVYFSANLLLIRSVWGMNRAQMGKLFNCSDPQIGTYERGVGNPPVALILELESKTGLTARQLYYDFLTRTDILQHPLMETDNVPTTSEAFLPASNNHLSLSERVKRLELKVFGA